MYLIGNWRDQLQTLNTWLESNNDFIVDKKKHMSLISEREWWIFWGIVISGCPAGKGGQKLFEKPKERRFTPAVNFGTGGENIMSFYRFKSIKEKMHYSFYDKAASQTDPWHPILLLIDGFNENRKQTVAASSKQSLMVQ